MKLGLSWTSFVYDNKYSNYHQHAEMKRTVPDCAANNNITFRIGKNAEKLGVPVHRVKLVFALWSVAGIFALFRKGLIEAKSRTDSSAVSTRTALLTATPSFQVTPTPYGFNVSLLHPPLLMLVLQVLVRAACPASQLKLYSMNKICRDHS